MSRKVSAPKPVKALAAEVSEALGAHNLKRPVNCEHVPGKPYPHWKLVARQIPISLDKSFPGHWRLNMNWKFFPIPPDDKELKILESSIGLYGAQVPALGGGDEEVCLVRYDTSLTEPGSNLEPLGSHLNVHQPGKLEDKVHYKMPGLSDHEWRIGEVLDFLLSARFVKDLSDRLH